MRIAVAASKAPWFWATSLFKFLISSSRLCLSSTTQKSVDNEILRRGQHLVSVFCYIQGNSNCDVRLKLLAQGGKGGWRLSGSSRVAGEAGGDGGGCVLDKLVVSMEGQRAGQVNPPYLSTEGDWLA